MSNTSLIWDLDGTLLDSYDVIVSSLYEIYFENGIKLDKQQILQEIIDESVAEFIKKMEEKYNISFEPLKKRYSEISHSKVMNIVAMEHAIEILELLKNKGIKNYVFTHRGVTTERVLKNTGLYPYFDEIICSLDGFPRKPDPKALNYLIDKYHLDRDNTYYVGDRSIDIECANNAHIKSILFISKRSVGRATNKESFVVKDLLDIEKLV